MLTLLHNTGKQSMQQKEDDTSLAVQAWLASNRVPPVLPCNPKFLFLHH